MSEPSASMISLATSRVTWPVPRSIETDPLLFAIGVLMSCWTTVCPTESMPLMPTVADLALIWARPRSKPLSAVCSVVRSLPRAPSVLTRSSTGLTAVWMTVPRSVAIDPTSGLRTLMFAPARTYSLSTTSLLLSAEVARPPSSTRAWSRTKSVSPLTESWSRSSVRSTYAGSTPTPVFGLTAIAPPEPSTPEDALEETSESDSL